MTEREIKLRVSAQELMAVRGRLQEQGAELAVERHHEINLVFDDPDATLRRERRLLRLREWRGRLRCTYKGVPSLTESGIKDRAEYEVDLAHADQRDDMIRLLAGLGYEPTLRYDKYREAWHLNGSTSRHEVVLDETPIGHFLEIEGPEPSIWVTRLGLDGQQVESQSYPELWSRRRVEDPSLPRDMVFETTDPRQTDPQIDLAPTRGEEC